MDIPLNNKCYKNNIKQIQKNIFNDYRKNKHNNSIFFLNKNKTFIYDEKIDVEEDKKKYKLSNINSLNFQLVSGVSKEKLLKLSKNLSKTIIKSRCNIAK